MSLITRIINAIERRNLRAERAVIHRNRLDLVAEGRLARIHARLVEMGDKSVKCLPYLGEEPEKMVRGVIEDDCGVPDGLVGEWRAPV